MLAWISTRPTFFGCVIVLTAGFCDLLKFSHNMKCFRGADLHKFLLNCCRLCYKIREFTTFNLQFCQYLAAT